MESNNYIGDLNIAGALFKIEFGHLVQRDQAVNALPIKLLKDNGDHLSGYVDRMNYNIYAGHDTHFQDSINVDSFSVLKAYLEFPSLDQGEIQRLNEQSIARRMDVVMIDERMNARLSGVLPKVKIAESWYEANLEQSMFKNMKHPSDQLIIPQHTAYFHRNYYYYFMKDSHRLAGVDLNATTVPQHALLLEVPVHLDVCHIDPAVQRMARTPLEKLACKPFIWDAELRLLPLEASNLQEITARNLMMGANDLDRDKGFVIKDVQAIKARLSIRTNHQRKGLGL